MPRVGFCAECGVNVWLTEEGACPRGHDASCISSVYDADPQPQPQPARPRRALPWILIGGGVLALLVAVSAAVWLLTSAIGSRGPLLGYGASETTGPYSALPRDVRMRFEDDYPRWSPNGADTWVTGKDSEATEKYVINATPPDRDFSLGVSYQRHASGVITAEDSVLRPNSVYAPYGDSLLDYLEKHYVSKGHRIYEVSTTDEFVFVVWAEEVTTGPFTREQERSDLLYRETGGYQWLLFVDPAEEE